MEVQNGVLDATSADFSSAVYEIDGEWAFYPEVLGSGAELNTAQPGERNESIPYGSYRLKIHAQPKQYLTLGGYSFDYSTRVLVNGSKVLEIGKVGTSAAESEPRIDYMLIPIYTGEDGTVEVVCQYANFVHREGGGLTQMHLSTAENIDRMRRSRNLYSLVLGGSLCLFGMYFLLFAVFQGEIKYVFLAVICVLLGLRDQNFYVLHLLPANYNWAVAYRFLVLMITLQPCFLLLLLQSLYEKLAKPIVVRCYTALYAVLAAAHFILPTQDIAPLSKIGYYLSIPFFLYLVVQLIRRFWRIRRFERDDVLVLLGYLLLYGYDVSGHAYQMRLFGLAAGALLVCAVFYGNHRGNAYELCAGDILPAFDLRHPRSKWQLCQIICVPLVLFLAELSGMPRAMWAGIAAMSAILPAMDDMRYRVRWRIIGNIAGVCCFLVLYFLLPSSIYAYIGVIGGIGVGFSAKYGWQAVFNTFGALAIATSAYGLKSAVGLRVAQNMFGVVFALLFCLILHRIFARWERSAS